MVGIGEFALVWDMIGGLVKGFSSQRKEVFNNHIEPLQEKMIVIHKDYLSGFQEVRHHLEMRTKPSIELLDFLNERSRSVAFERQLANDLAKELGKLHKIGVREGDFEILSEYAKSIFEYFSASSTIGKFSWYSHFIDIVRFNIYIEVINDVWQTDTIAGREPRLVLIDSVDYVLNKGLPDAFSKISKSYAILRGSFL